MSIADQAVRMAASLGFCPECSRPGHKTIMDTSLGEEVVICKGGHKYRHRDRLLAPEGKQAPVETTLTHRDGRTHIVVADSVPQARQKLSSIRDEGGVWVDTGTTKCNDFWPWHAIDHVSIQDNVPDDEE